MMRVGDKKLRTIAATDSFSGDWLSRGGCQAMARELLVLRAMEAAWREKPSSLLGVAAALAALDAFGPADE